MTRRRVEGRGRQGSATPTAEDWLAGALAVLVVLAIVLLVATS